MYFFDNQEIGFGSEWAGLIRAMTADNQVNHLWSDWLSSKLTQYQHTDGDVRLFAIRCAVDGAWLNHVPADDLSYMQDYLLKLVDEVSEC